MTYAVVSRYFVVGGQTSRTEPPPPLGRNPPLFRRTEVRTPGRELFFLKTGDRVWRLPVLLSTVPDCIRPTRGSPDPNRTAGCDLGAFCPGGRLQYFVV